MTSPTGGRPGRDNTGVPDGTDLRVHQGDLKITKDNTVIDGVEVRGYVYVQADNVTIRNSVIRGGQVTTSDRALIMSWWGARNLAVTDTTLEPTSDSLRADGVSGAGFTLDRVDISGVVDPVKIIGDDVTVQRSFLHSTMHSASDPNQPDGRTHDDNVQIVGGSSIRLIGNTMQGAANAAIMVSSARHATGGIDVTGNWLSGGGCTINITTADQGPIRDMVISGNRFGEGNYGTSCAVRRPRSSDITVTGNAFLDGTAITEQIF